LSRWRVLCTATAQVVRNNDNVRRNTAKYPPPEEWRRKETTTTKKNNPYESKRRRAKGPYKLGSFLGMSYCSSYLDFVCLNQTTVYVHTQVAMGGGVELPPLLPTTSKLRMSREEEEEEDEPVDNQHSKWIYLIVAVPVAVYTTHPLAHWTEYCKIVSFVRTKRSQLYCCGCWNIKWWKRGGVRVVWVGVGRQMRMRASSHITRGFSGQQTDHYINTTFVQSFLQQQNKPKW